MFEPERLKKVHNKTYIMQHPQYNNCMIIALFNAVLDDNPSFDLKELFKEEKRLNDKYEIHKRGTRIELLGGIAWEYGYDVIIHFKHATSQLFNFKNYYNKGDKILRLESWNIYDNDNLSKSEKRRSKKIKKYMNDFLNKYQLHKNKIKERKLITNCSGFARAIASA